MGMSAPKPPPPRPLPPVQQLPPIEQPEIVMPEPPPPPEPPPEPEPPPKQSPPPKTGSQPVQEARDAMSRQIASRNGRSQTRRSGAGGVSNYSWLQRRSIKSGMMGMKTKLGE